MSDDEAALLAEIVANPDDDAPRLVLADWWTQRGDPRGEFVVAQCALAVERAKPDPDLAALVPLRLRVAALLEEHQPRWLEPLGVTEKHVYWVRGFVEQLRGEAGAFIGAPRPLFDQPIRDLEVSLQDTPADLDALCALPWPASLHKLHVDNPGTAPLTRALAAAPFAQRLTALRVPRCNLVDADLDAIAKLAAPLRTLDIGGNRFSAAAIERLIEVRRPYLHDLTLGGSELEESYVGMLADRPELGELRELWIGDEQVPEAALVKLATSRHLTQLTHLVTFYLTIRDAATVAALASSPMLPNLRRLGLFRAGLSLDGLRALASSSLAARLVELDVPGSTFGDAGAAILGEAFSSLRQLNVEQCELTSRGVLALARSPAYARFSRIDLGHNALGDLGTPAGELVGPAMTYLGIGSTGLRDDAVVAIARSPGLAHLEWLHLSLNEIGDRGALALAASPHATAIDVVFLSYNEEVSDEVLDQLAARFGDRLVFRVSRDRVSSG